MKIFSATQQHKSSVDTSLNYRDGAVLLHPLRLVDLSNMILMQGRITVKDIHRVGQNPLDTAEGSVQRCEVVISPREARKFFSPSLKNFQLSG